jgi:hypothetical protein
MNSSHDLRQESAPDSRAGYQESPGAPPPYSAAWRRRDFYPEDSRAKSPAFATLMSLVPGLGQVYVGYYQQGFINILVIASLITLLNRGLGDVTPLAAIFMAFYWLYNIVDAARRAMYYNQALSGTGPLEMPVGLAKPDTMGSLYGGLLLIVFGGLVLGHTLFGYSLEWLERWWPVVLVLMGVYLVYRSFADRLAEKKAASR